MNGRAATTRGIVLSVGLRTSDSTGRPAGVSWAGDSPAAALAVDILTASGGTAGPPRGSILGARFFDLQSAMLAARRLVWALEGLSESTQSTTAATIAIHSLEEGLSEAVVPVVESLAQGEIVLSTRIAEMVRQLPGVHLREAPGGNWRELQWRSEGSKNQAADEQSVLGLIRALGREDPLAARAEAPAAAPGSAVSATSGVYEAPANLGRSLAEPETAPPLWKKPWVAVSAGVAVLVLLAVVIIPVMVSGNHAKAPAPDASTKAAPPASPGVAPSAAPVPGSLDKPPDHKPPAKSPKQPKNEPKPEVRSEPRPDTKTEPPPPKPAPVSCGLTEGEIPLSLQRAERLMFAGKLPEAQDAYQRLVGCPSAHDKAVEGLRLVRQRIAAQSPSGF